MTNAYPGENAPEKVGGYLRRLDIGAMTALVVAKACIPVIADASAHGWDAAINPYFVSLIAIISGLLSQNAVADIQAQGARFFGRATRHVDRRTRGDVLTDLQS
jgi:hypothetical protein